MLGQLMHRGNTYECLRVVYDNVAENVFNLDIKFGARLFDMDGQYAFREFILNYSNESQFLLCEFAEICAYLKLL